MTRLAEITLRFWHVVSRTPVVLGLEASNESRIARPAKRLWNIVRAADSLRLDLELLSDAQRRFSAAQRAANLETSGQLRGGRKMRPGGVEEGASRSSGGARSMRGSAGGAEGIRGAMRRPLQQGSGQCLQPPGQQGSCTGYRSSDVSPAPDDSQADAQQSPGVPAKPSSSAPDDGEKDQMGGDSCIAVTAQAMTRTVAFCLYRGALMQGRTLCFKQPLFQFPGLSGKRWCNPGMVGAICAVSRGC